MESRLLIWIGSLLLAVINFFRAIFVSSRDRTFLVTEGRDKFRVMGLVQARSSYFGAAGNPDIGMAIARIEEREAYAVPWAIKGIGKDAVESGMDARAVFRAACTSHAARQGRFDPRLMIASGIGMAFARPPIRMAKADPSASALKMLARDFSTQVEAAEMGDHLGAAVESLGLCARVMADGEFNRALASAVLEAVPEYYAYYCHGAGRALYFHPSNLLSDAALHSSAPGRAMDEAPDEAGAACMLAGVHWAQTLVGLDSPAMLLWRMSIDVPVHGRWHLAAAAMASALVSRMTIDRHSTAIQSLSALQPGNPMEAQAMEAVVWPAVEAARSVMAGPAGQGLGIGKIYGVAHLEELAELN